MIVTCTKCGDDCVRERQQRNTVCDRCTGKRVVKAAKVYSLAMRKIFKTKNKNYVE
jgi:DNA-directed RNA polymerase subunit RPC12/RpoP